jgi:hypothetical protein
VFVCDACERRLIWSGIGRRLIDGRHAAALLFPAVGVAVSLRRGIPDLRGSLDLAGGVLVLVLSAGWLLFRWRSRRLAVLRELLFESRREVYAAQLGRPAASLAVYPPRGEAST